MRRRNKNIFTEESHRGRAFLIGLSLVLLLLFAALFTWNFALNHTVSDEKKYVTIPSLSEPLEGFTILHLSDMNGQFLGENHAALRKVLANKNPSCVVLSGNMVGPEGDASAVLALLEILPKGTTVLLLPGDDDPPLYLSTAHSSLSHYAPWAEKLQQAGVLLLDEPRAITRGKSTIWFIPEGLYSLDIDNSRDAWQAQMDALSAITGDLTGDQAALRRNAIGQLERLERIRTTLSTIKDSDVQVVVSHMPLTKEYIVASRNETARSGKLHLRNASLILSGGYCGGQWRLPLVGAIWAPELGFFPEDHLLQGMSYTGGVWQHISPGLDVNPMYPLLPFRLFNSPAATLLVLTATNH